ncbi:MAG: bifunctional phosphoribosylaminoimidazolecarboxamide formyltransferase/IMP cyclohydrolase [Alphaproteobacteria bacterium]|nr:bifunctional phosphoribosylaminoimidazolecarboxamide formyltransferase/IMP cyclohydrolase [Alphaproteobacteria bacterium]
MSSQNLRPVRRALLSVSDKTGLIEFAQSLSTFGVELISTGGTAKALTAAGLKVTDVAAVTGFPEMMDGRLKTLHPRVHGGLLALRDEPTHAKAMQEHGIEGIDLLVCNLYPFEETVARKAGFDETIENIDIGGPAMIRAASKNHSYVAVIVDVEDYAPLLAELAANKGATTLTTRKQLAARAYARTAAYDVAISTWFGQATAMAQKPEERTPPRRFALAGHLKQTLRYGENPHQGAAFYTTGEHRFGVATATQVGGKELSFNNINDTDAAYECVAEFDAKTTAAIAIIKHANPCGVATAATLAEAYKLALRCDPVSAYGGIVACNRLLDGATAAELAKIFTEVIIAPDADEEARKILSAKKNLRLLLAQGLPDPATPGMNLRTVAGGFLLQSRDNGRVTENELRVVTKRKPTDRELKDLLFAFRVAKHVKSNTIVYAKDGATVGIGAGQMSRIDSARIAAWKAQEAARAAGLTESLAKGSAVASDAFFPFADGLIAAADAGATAVIQPGGSMRDEEVIAAADERGLAMVLTSMRHFRH